MLAFVLFLVLVYVIVGIVGAVVHGLLWLTIVAGVLFLLTVFLGGSRVGKNRARTSVTTATTAVQERTRRRPGACPAPGDRGASAGPSQAALPNCSGARCTDTNSSARPAASSHLPMIWLSLKPAGCAGTAACAATPGFRCPHPQPTGSKKRRSLPRVRRRFRYGAVRFATGLSCG